MSREFDLFAACLPGLEPLLVRELELLGATPRALRGGVAFSGDARCVTKACLWLGTASHVMLRVAEFRCRALGELQRKATLLPWADWLRPGMPIDVRATSRASRTYHTGAIVERIENSIAEALGRAPEPLAPGDETTAHVHVRFSEDVCTISLDATTTPLHRRGYRLDGRKAPLREDLAHAMVLASRWSPEQPLLDPFCGSGTIVIEAAGIAGALPPGRLRPPPLHHLALFDHGAWEAERATVRPPRGGGAISASDRDAGAIAAARANSERAGVADRIEFTNCAFTEHPWLGKGPAGAESTAGAVISNPPFGIRVPRAATLAPLWQTIGHRITRLGPGWTATLLAHDVRLARRAGLPLRAAWTTRHGGLPVTCLVGGQAAEASNG